MYDSTSMRNSQRVPSFLQQAVKHRCNDVEHQCRLQVATTPAVITSASQRNVAAIARKCSGASGLLFLVGSGWFIRLLTSTLPCLRNAILDFGHCASSNINLNRFGVSKSFSKVELRPSCFTLAGFVLNVLFLHALVFD